MLSTHTLERFPEINLDDILRTVRKFEEDHPFRVHRLKCSPEAYIALKDFFVEKEHEDRLREAVAKENRKKRGLEPLPEINNYWGSLYGIDIVLDPDQKPGEMEFE